MISRAKQGRKLRLAAGHQLNISVPELDDALLQTPSDNIGEYHEVVS
jgi:hypothetical protein